MQGNIRINYTKVNMGKYILIFVKKTKDDDVKRNGRPALKIMICGVVGS